METGIGGLPTSGEVASRCRTQWPWARFRARGDAVHWIDGPARIDVHAHLVREGIDRATLERSGVRLQRRISRPVLAAVALQSLEVAGGDIGPCRELVQRHAATAIDDLLLYEIPATGGPPLSPDGSVPPQARWERARALAALLPTTRPVDPHRPTSWRPVLDRLLTLVCLVDPVAPARGFDHRRLAAGGRAQVVESDPVIDGPHPLRLTVQFAGWLDHDFVAVTHPQHSGATGDVEVELHWTDGPSPAEVVDRIAVEGWPAPLRRDVRHRAVRTLSPTTIAAAVLLYRHLHGEPYRDDAARYHWMARWRSSSVRRIDRRWRFARERLRAIEAQLLTLPLPLEGPLPDRWRSAGDGTALWQLAETLLAVTPRPASSPSIDPTIERASLPVDLAATYEELGHDTLTLLRTP